MVDLCYIYYVIIFIGQLIVIKEDVGQQFEFQVMIELNQVGILILVGDQSLEYGVFLNFDIIVG